LLAGVQYGPNSGSQDKACVSCSVPASVPIGPSGGPSGGPRWGSRAIFNMKVLNLQCQHGHVFEGWFASHDEFAMQQARGLMSCPVCNDEQIIKMPSAPRLNLGASSPVATAPGQTGDHGMSDAPGQAQHSSQAVAQMTVQQMQATWMKMVRHVVANTEDVGEHFAREARKIHRGQAPERGIRGQASRAETQALLEEGIGVLPLPVPAALKETLQ
jgi:hypothetical protein